jgi:hypothetical protein
MPEFFRVYFDAIGGNTYADIDGTARDKKQVTLSGGTATEVTPTAEPTGELRGLEFSEGHVFYRAGGRFIPVGTDHGPPARGIVYPLSTDDSGNLFYYTRGEFLAATIVA